MALGPIVIILNHKEQKESIVVDNFDAAADYFSEYIGGLLKDAKVPAWARAKVGVVGHVDSGIKIKAAFDSGDDTAVVKEVGGIISGVIAGKVLGTITVTFATAAGMTISLPLLAGIIVAGGITGSSDEVKDEIADAYDYLKNGGAKKLGEEASAFMDEHTDKGTQTLIILDMVYLSDFLGIF
jgi:hypothetical protein